MRVSTLRVKTCLEDDPQSAVEASLLGRLKHQGIVRMYEAYSDGVTLDLLLELCTEGSMADYVVSRIPRYLQEPCATPGPMISSWHALWSNCSVR